MDDPKLAQIVELHRNHNRNTAPMYDEFSLHREMVSKVIDQCLKTLPPRPGNELPTLTIWGAGNTNDLDLPNLCARFRMIQLIDLDPNSLDRALQRTDLTDDNKRKIRLIGQCDATGMLQLLAELGGGSADPQKTAAETARLIALAESARPTTIPSQRAAEIAATDVVVSTCLLSQLIDTVFKTLGNDFVEVNSVVLAVRDNHLRMLLDAVATGAVAALVTDFVSSDTLPELQTEMPTEDFYDLVVKALNERNFFTGTNPVSIQQRLQSLFACQQAGPTKNENRLKLGTTQPWRWSFGERSFATFGLIFLC